MQNQYFLFIISLALSGCSGISATSDMRIDQPLIQIPVNSIQGQAGLDDNDGVGFQDISLSAKRRLQVLTNKMEIDQLTDKYINKGQADVITRPDGTIVYPYGLAQVDLTTKRMRYSKICLLYTSPSPRD